MALEVNAHVARLRAFQPSGGSGGQLLAENSDTQRSDELDTRAFRFVRAVLDSPLTRMVVLTGDAGHGKTHLTRRVLQDLGVDGSVKDLIREQGVGLDTLATLDSGRKLRVIKDLSEISEVEGKVRLRELLRDDSLVTIVCANEGRLRSALSDGGPELDAIREALDGVLSLGRTSPDGRVHVIDLNHQSVAALGGDSLVNQLLRTWVVDQRKWSICDRCDAQPECPIAENRRLLADHEQSERGESRRRGIEALLRAAEQSGSVVTIRELLIFAAHILTGGLDCARVHEQVAHRPDGTWQHRFLFHEAAFGSQLQPGEQERLEVFRAVARFDPGTIANRLVDDVLVGEQSSSAGRFLPATGLSVEPSARSQGARQREAERQRTLIRFLRRRSFFDAEADSDGAISFAQRLGFRFYDDFELLVTPERQPLEKVPVRDDLLVGLEAIQGARRRPGQSSFLVVDPAFSSHRGDASVVARQVAKPDIELMGQSEWWSLIADESPDLQGAVDWTDRRVYVVIEPQMGVDPPPRVELDARQFEFVMRAASGLVSRQFFQAEIRRIMAELALIAEAGTTTDSDEITVLIGEGRRKLVIDVGNVIVATEV